MDSPSERSTPIKYADTYEIRGALLSVSLALNAALSGPPGMTLCARTYHEVRLREDQPPFYFLWYVLYHLIDACFLALMLQRHHCRIAYDNYLMRIGSKTG